MHVKELFDLSGRTAIVTGGGTGLGRQMAEALAELGSNLVLCARKAERCEQAAAELAQLGVGTLGLGCDVRRREHVEGVVRQTVEKFGRVDILVNNSGTSWKAAPEEIPDEGWQKVIDVNLSGVFLFAQAAGREMIRQGDGGKIVNVASVAAFRGAQPEVMDSLPYNASKGGVVSLTIDLAVKWARHRINVNAIAPGWFPTEMTTLVFERTGAHRLTERVPLGRFGGPDDLKGTIAFLASRASDYVTGTTIIVDGGQTVS
jgi:NAD(P)-dependent dehydrogenase (short-subunit alcohol dehydrogenase family)